MDDTGFRKQKNRVLTAFKRWAGPTGIGDYIICHVWHRDGTCGKDEGQPEHEGYTTTARASVSWEYLHVCFHWNLEQIATNNDAELDRVIRQEIAHVLINEMRMWGPPFHRDEQARDEAMKHEERVVTRLGSVFLWCRQKGQIESRRNRKGTRR